MNRRFWTPEKEMPAPVKHRQRQLIGSLRKSTLRDEQDELGLLIEMKKREKEDHDLHQNPKTEVDSTPGSGTENIPVFSMHSATTVQKTVADGFLNSENDKNNYDRPMAYSETPIFPSPEMESQKTVMNGNGTRKAHPDPLKSRLSSTQPGPNAKNGLGLKPRAASPGPGAGPGRSSGSGSKPSTPTSKPVLSSQARSISNPVSKTNSTSTTTVRPRSSTPTSTGVRPRSSTPSSTDVRPRSSTPTSTGVRPRSSTPSSKGRSNASSSKPTNKPSLSTTKPTPRAPTPPPPPQRPTISSNVTKTLAPNIRASLTDRQVSSIRGRAGGPSNRSSSIEPISSGRVRRQSSSPSRGRLPNGENRKSGSSVPLPSLNRAYAKANDNANPGLYGTKMVERVVNMRRLAPPKQDDKHSNSSLKPSSLDSSGFGRSLSKKSLEMAMRHMDIRRTLPSNLRPLMTKIQVSSDSPV